MKTLRTVGILVAVALAAVTLALLPVLQAEVTSDRPGIAVGEASDAGGAGGAERVDLDPAATSTADGTGDPEGTTTGEDTSVALPRSSASEQPVSGVHSDTGVGAMETEPSPEPADTSSPATRKPSTDSSPSSDTSSSGSSGSSGGGSSSGSSDRRADDGASTPPRPSSVCEWDDGELDCDEDDDDDDDDDD